MLTYEGKVFRPPSEWRSLIVQATVGCANNTCTFCSMYKEDSFHIKPEEQLFKELEEEAQRFNKYQRIFIADGDALCLKTDYLVRLLRKLKELFPSVERISIYGTALDLLRKSVDELNLLREEGLEMIYLGVETGDGELLKKIRKNITPEQYVEAAKKAKAAKISLSVTLIAGLAGREGSKQHAIESAKIASKMNPKYLSFLTLYLEPGAPMYMDLMRGKFELMKPEEILEEIYIFLDHYTGEGPTVFRANHASNYTPLAGDLPEDREALMETIEAALKNKQFRSEHFRSL